MLDRLSNDPQIRLTNYGEFLELHPPEWEVEIHENSSWSCAHGVDRWRADCGCKTRGDWHQLWRAPLRRALDGLKEQLDHLFGTRGRECFPDPWAARDAYIQVVLDHDEATMRRFLRRHGHPDLDASQERDALRLLEMQRDAMLMFTSCGWFFDEISGIETVQCLHYAARAIHMARHFGRDFEGPFLQFLEQAPSNLPQYKDGRRVWELAVRPSVVDLDRVLAHHAINLIDRPHDETTRVYTFDIEAIDQEVHGRGNSHVAIGWLRVRSRQTWNEAETTFVVIHFGGLDFHAVLREAFARDQYEDFKRRLLETYRTGSLADVTTLVATEFPGRAHRLDDLFSDEQRRIIGVVLQDRFLDYERTFERLANQDEDVLNRLGHLHYPIPKPLRAAASAYLDLHLRRAIDRLEEGPGLDPIRELIERGRAWGYEPERDLLEKSLAEALERTLGEIDPDADLAALTVRAGLILDAAALLGIQPDLWEVQNQLLDLFVRHSGSGSMTRALSRGFAELADRLNVSQDLLGWKP